MSTKTKPTIEHHPSWVQFGADGGIDTIAFVDSITMFLSKLKAELALMRNYDESHNDDSVDIVLHYMFDDVSDAYKFASNWQGYKQEVKEMQG
jgi:hypothetical protein